MQFKVIAVLSFVSFKHDSVLSNTSYASSSKLYWYEASAKIPKPARNYSTLPPKHDHKPTPRTGNTIEDERPLGLTNEDIILLLKSRHYRVQNFSDGSLLAFMGDTVYYPEKLLPELTAAEDDRSTNVQKKKLWIDANGNQQVWYYYDISTQADQKVFEEAVGTWAKYTCIRFQKMKAGNCNENRGHGAICVGNFGGCFSHVGNSYLSGWNRQSQRMSVQPRGCEMVAAAHEFGHALGLQHQQSRSDREQHMFVNFNNLDIKMEGQLDDNVHQAWNQAGKCSSDQMIDLPIPYDFMSIMQYGASDFAMEDGRIIYSAKNARHQYMCNYHRTAGMTQTHYDKLTINTAYKCINLWTQTCRRNGQEPPKCRNNGFVTKQCRCACPDGFTGSTCVSKSGSLYPVQDRAKTMIDMTLPGLVDLAHDGEMHLEYRNYPLQTFVFYQFITVTVNTHHKRLTPVVDIYQPFMKVASAFGPRGQNLILRNMAIADCETTLFFYWGDAATNKLRTECISSMINNEFQTERPQLRVRNNTLDIVVICFVGKMFRKPEISMLAMELKVDVQFKTNPALQLRNFKHASEDPGPLEAPTIKGGNSWTGLIIGILVAIIVCVLIIVCVVFACKKGMCKKWANKLVKKFKKSKLGKKRKEKKNKKHDKDFTTSMFGGPS